MKTKEELEEAIKDAIIMYKELFLYGMSGWTSKAASHWSGCVWSKTDGRYDEETCMGETSKKKIIMDGDTMIDKKTGEVLGPEAESTYWKDKF